MQNLRNTFLALSESYLTPEQSASLWNEIEEHYSLPERHYHTLIHLEDLLLRLEEVRDLIDDWETVLFCLFYHDVIYDASKSDNEEQSAELAKKRLEEIGIPGKKIQRCLNQILATKSHRLADDDDTNLFTDADLSILGSQAENYNRYAKNVRKEYSIYPDELYNPGRKKVLQHFLAMERIFKTAYFFDRYESQARKNIQSEIERL